jgi:putative glycosyltransferase (TIGR04348 family)
MSNKHLRSVCIVTPALADANNGNWQTARRWATMLSGDYAVRLCRQWPDGGADADVLLALHARRSAASVAAWAQAHPTRPLLVALTGTDLYRDIGHDTDAQRSLALATRLLVLQDQAPLSVPVVWRDKVRVVLQSCSARQALPKTTQRLRVLVVGHLRDEKAPQTVWAAARLLAPGEGIAIDHLGAALDAELGREAVATQAACPHYRWLGAQPHEAARRRMQRAHLLLHPSRMEGGAHVVMEAVQSGTPVLASKVDGNVGMLGTDYGGYFALDDAEALVALLRRCRREQVAGGPGWLDTLAAQCQRRAPLFEPAVERAALRSVVAEALAACPATPHTQEKPC